MPAEDDDTGVLWLDGQKVTVDDLTFREQRTMREYARTLAPDNNMELATEADVIPALIAVWMQRSDKSYSLDQALDLKPGDLEKKPVVDPTPDQ